YRARSGGLLAFAAALVALSSSVGQNRVPEVPPAVAGRVLGKAVEPHRDGRHYTRDISNVGPKTKLLVGKPVLE
ncbi:MAG: hypothetical protein WCP98_21515, partial [Actinomycetes bacterium]